MIEFKEGVEIRDSGIIYQSLYEQIRKLYAKSPEQAGELAIAAISLVLTGEINSDDYMIEIILENLKVVSGKNKDKYEKKVNIKNQKRIEEQQLDLIAEWKNKGVKQNEMARRLGTTPQTISKRVGLIETEYPYLLAKNQLNQPNQSNQLYDNVNDNVNVNIDCVEPKGAQSNQGGCCANAQPPAQFHF